VVLDSGTPSDAIVPLFVRLRPLKTFEATSSHAPLLVEGLAPGAAF